MKKRLLLTAALLLIGSMVFAGVVDFTGDFVYGFDFAKLDDKFNVTSSTEKEAKLTATVNTTYAALKIGYEDGLNSSYGERTLQGYLSFKLGKALNNTFFPDLPSGSFTLLCGKQGAMQNLTYYPDYFARDYDRVRLINKSVESGKSVAMDTIALTISYFKPHQGRIYVSPLTDSFDTMAALRGEFDNGLDYSLSYALKGLFALNDFKGTSTNYYANGFGNVSVGLDLEEYFWLENPAYLAVAISYANDTYTISGTSEKPFYKNFLMGAITGQASFGNFDITFETGIKSAFEKDKHQNLITGDLIAKYNVEDYLDLGVEGTFDGYTSSTKEEMDYKAVVTPYVEYTVDMLTTKVGCDFIKSSSSDEMTYKGFVTFTASLESGK